MSQKLPESLLSQMRDIVESAPGTVRPLMWHAAAVFLKREEPRWDSLSLDTRLTEERFYNFLNCPSSYDLVMESYAGDWDPMIYSKDHPATQPLGYAANKSKFTTCWDCDGSGQDWKDKSKKCYTCYGTGKALKSLREGADDWKETRCEPCKGLPDGKCTACGGKGWTWTNSKTGQKDLRYGNPVKYGRMDEDKKCPVCDGQGWVWNHPEPGEDVILSGIECPHCHGTGVLKEDAAAGAPANAAGNGAVAGIGQPEGSAFGEPGVTLGGATTKTRKKNKRPDDLEEGNASDLIPKTMDAARVLKLPSEHHYDTMVGWVEGDKERIAKLTALLTHEKDPISLATVRSSLAHAKQELAAHERELAKIGQEIERYRADKAAGVKRDGKSPLHESMYDWVCQKCGKIWGPADDVPKKCPRCGSTDAKRRDDSELDEGTQAYKGYLIQVDYLGRVAIRKDNQHIAWAKTEDDAKAQIDMLTEETFAGAEVFAVDTDRWMKSRFGKNRYHRYARYVGDDAVGETIRNHGRKSKGDIVLKDQTTGVMTYLRRKRPVG